MLLPLPVGPIKSHGLTAFGFEADVVEHVFLRVGIPETDVFKLHHALFVLLALRALALDNFGLGVDDLDDTLCRYVGSRHDHQKHAQHEKAHEHLHGILRKHRHCRIVQISRVYQRSAQPINGEHKSAHDQIHAGEHYAHHFVDKHIDARKFFVCVAEFLGLIILGVVGAHHSQAGEIFTRYAVQTVDFFCMTENLGLATRKTVIIISSSATTATPVASDSSRLLLTTRTTAEIAMTGAIMPNFNTIIIVCCICMTSFVVRVIKLAVLNFSISSMLKEFTFLKISSGGCEQACW